jgi:Zn-dependent peptidase ImmA (M78 family)
VNDTAWTPTKAAARLTKQLNAFAQIHGTDRFPVNVVELAHEAANLFQWPDSIVEVEGLSIKGLEGALFSNEEKTAWKLLYNNTLPPGRTRFTQAHELGHYCLHRLEQESFQCTEGDMLDWGDGPNIEQQADTFASHLLMPLDDFRAQIRGEDVSLDLLGHCTERYGTSLTATILKWLECTNESAVFVMSREGYICWARSSKKAMEAGAYFTTRGRPPIAIPEGSLAANSDVRHDRVGTNIASPHWFPRAEEQFPIREMKLTADGYDYTMSLLLLPRYVKAWAPWEDRPQSH